MPAPIPTITLDRRIARLDYPIGRQDGKWFTIFKEFNLLPAGTQAVTTDNDFDLTLGAGTDAPSASTFLAPTNRYGGGVNGVTSAVTTLDTASIFPLAVSRWGQAIQPVTNNRQVIEAVIRTSASIATMAIIFGWKLTDTAVHITDADQAYFLYDTAATTPAGSTANWVAVHSAANVDTVTATGTAVAASTDYKMAVSIDADLKPRFYLNDALVATGTTALVTASINLLPVFMVRTNTTAAATAGIRYLKLSRYIA